MIDIISFYPCKTKVTLGDDEYTIIDVGYDGTQWTYTCEAYIEGDLRCVMVYEYQFKANSKDKVMYRRIGSE